MRGMFFVVDTLSNNVLAECESYAQAEQRRIETIGQNPDFADFIEVVDMAHELQTYDSAHMGEGMPTART